MGVGGFIVSMLLCGLVLVGRPQRHARRRADLHPVRDLSARSTARSAARRRRRPRPISPRKTRRSGRVAALSALSSSFGLGTIIGPAMAPLFVLPFVGLPGPLFAFAAIGAAGVRRDPAVAARRPRCGRRVGRGAAMSYPSLATHADRRQRRRGDLAATHAAEVERPAHPAVDHRRGRRRAMPRRRP